MQEQRMIICFCTAWLPHHLDKIQYQEIDLWTNFLQDVSSSSFPLKVDK